MTGRVLQFGKRKGWVTVNVIRELERDERAFVPAKTNRKGLPLEADELQRLLAAAHASWRTVFLAGALSGLRQSELLGLSWGDIQWDAHVIRVRQQLLGRDGELRDVKTDAGNRDVVLSPTLARELRKLFMQSYNKTATGLVFVNGERKLAQPSRRARHLSERLSEGGHRGTRLPRFASHFCLAANRCRRRCGLRFASARACLAGRDLERLCSTSTTKHGASSRPQRA